MTDLGLLPFDIAHRGHPQNVIAHQDLLPLCDIARPNRQSLEIAHQNPHHSGTARPDHPSLDIALLNHRLSDIAILDHRHSDIAPQSRLHREIAATIVLRVLHLGTMSDSSVVHPALLLTDVNGEGRGQGKFIDIVYSNHLKTRYLKEVDCSSVQFKSAKLKDKDYTKCSKF